MVPRSTPSNPRPGSSGRRTAIFAKRPVPGRVKTRLCPPLEPEAAALLADGMLADALERCLACPDFRTVLVHAPAADGAWFRERFPDLGELAPQRGEGLGERLARWFEQALAAPEVATAVAIGSDQPLVPTARMSEAHERLERGADVVLGPDLGGGYYLIGLRASRPELFLEVRMSTAGMCRETAELARARGLRVELLEPAYDVDDESDLLRLRADIAARDPREPEFPRHTARRLKEVLATSRGASR